MIRSRLKAKKRSGKDLNWKWLLIPLGVGALGCAGYFGQKGYKHYINKKRGGLCHEKTG